MIKKKKKIKIFGCRNVDIFVILCWVMWGKWMRKDGVDEGGEGRVKEFFWWVIVNNE